MIFSSPTHSICSHQSSSFPASKEVPWPQSNVLGVNSSLSSVPGLPYSKLTSTRCVELSVLPALPHIQEWGTILQSHQTQPSWSPLGLFATRSFNTLLRSVNPVNKTRRLRLSIFFTELPKVAYQHSAPETRI